jgi:hypothetical protein
MKVKNGKRGIDRPFHYLKNFQVTERALDLGHKSRECFAAFLQRHFTEEIDGQTTLAKMSKTTTKLNP